MVELNWSMGRDTRVICYVVLRVSGWFLNEYCISLRNPICLANQSRSVWGHHSGVASCLYSDICTECTIRHVSVPHFTSGARPLAYLRVVHAAFREDELHCAWCGGRGECWQKTNRPRREIKGHQDFKLFSKDHKNTWFYQLGKLNQKYVLTLILI